MKKNDNKTIRYFCKLILLTALFSLLLSVSAWAATVEYGNLRQLISEGNTSLNSAQQSLARIEWQISELRKAKLDVKELREIAEETGDVAAEQQYRMNEEQLQKSMDGLEKSYERQTGDRGTLESSINRLEKSAQSMMISYNQMVVKADAAQKSYEAAVEAYSAASNKYFAGTGGESEVSKASADMLNRQNQLESANQQLLSMRNSLLSILGITDDGTVTIGGVPDPDVAAISSIDMNADASSYLSYDTDYHNAKKTKVSGTRTEEATAEAKGNAIASYVDAYNQLQAELLTYQAQAKAFSLAQADYDALQRKRQAGMLTETQYKSGEATYYEALASYKSAAMNLLQKHLNYQWSLIGV